MLPYFTFYTHEKKLFFFKLLGFTPSLCIFNIISATAHNQVSLQNICKFASFMKQIVTQHLTRILIKLFLSSVMQGTQTHKPMNMFKTAVNLLGAHHILFILQEVWITAKLALAHRRHVGHSEAQVTHAMCPVLTKFPNCFLQALARNSLIVSHNNKLPMPLYLREGCWSEKVLKYC